MNGKELEQRRTALGRKWNIPKLARESGISPSALYLWEERGDAWDIRELYGEKLERVLAREERKSGAVI